MTAPMPTALPFGIRDIRLTRFVDDSGQVLGTNTVDLPVARTLSFSDAEEFEDLWGDDELQASHGSGPSLEWELEAGGISFDAWSVLGGGTVIIEGVSPARIRRLRKNTSNVRPYFRMEGQSINDSGGDLHGIIYRAKVTDNIEGELGQGAFFLTSCSGKGFGNKVVGVDYGALYDFVQNETVTPIPVATVNPTGG